MEQKWASFAPSAGSVSSWNSRAVSGPPRQALDIGLAGDRGQLAERSELGELGLVVRSRRAARPQAVAERERDVVRGHDLADLGEVRVEERFAMVGQAPLGHDRAAPRDDAGDALGGERDVTEEHARVDREVVDALLRLLDERVAVDLPGELLGLAADLLERLVDRHRADGHRRVAQDPLAGLVAVFARREI